MSKNNYIGWGFAFILMVLVANFFTASGALWTTYMFYLLASTSFIALPHEPALLYYGKQYGVLLPLFFSIIPTILGCYVDYLVLGPALRYKIFSRIRNNQFSRKLIDFFRINPFVTIFIAALSPVPFYPVRIMSIVSDYSVKKYTLAVLLGRLPRFIILAAGGQIIGLSNTELMVFLSLLLIWYFLTILHKMKTSRSKSVLYSPN